MISTKGRYTLRVMIDLAEHNNGEYIPMKDVAKRQEISLKYLERILPVLSQNKLVDSIHGKGGGYRLTKAPELYSVWEILQAAEGNLAPVACLECGAAPCSRAAECRTLSMWKKYYKLTEEYFSGITIADLMVSDNSTNYVI